MANHSNVHLQLITGMYTYGQSQEWFRRTRVAQEFTGPALLFLNNFITYLREKMWGLGFLR